MGGAVPKGPEWVGVELVRSSTVRPGSKRGISSRWRRWVAWCEEQGVPALASSGDDAVRWLRHERRSQSMVKETRKAVSLVYRGLGMASPFAQRQAMREVFGASGRYGAEEDYNPCAREAHRLRLLDYLRWCQEHGRAALPGSGRQVADFLLDLAKDYSFSMVEHASAGVSRYLEDNGCPGTSSHPAVRQAIRECETLCAKRVGPGQREPRVRTTTRRGVMQQHWTQWCQGQGMEWESAGAADALRYLRGLEYQRTAALRVYHLGLLYEEMEENPFSSAAVLDWRRQHAKRVGETSSDDWRVVRRAEEVIEEIRSARASGPTEVAVGLSWEEVADLTGDLSGDFAASTLRNYSRSFAAFEGWLAAEKKLALHQVRDQHVGAYLRHKSLGCRVSTLRSIATGLAMVFRELKDWLGLAENPVVTGLVDGYLSRLRRDRREQAAQMDPVRETDYQAVMASVWEPLAGERTGRAELRAALVTAIFSVMFDGMLRVSEAVDARWDDVSSWPDGSGRLYLPVSKTDQAGEGDHVYISRRSMAALDNLREVRRDLGGVKAKQDGRIFQLGEREILVLVREACEAAGLEGRFGTHSFRIGMAQELAVAGFGLVLIMRAGRWEDPGMPTYYNRGLDLDDGAVAEVHRIWARGGRRAEGESVGVDALSTYEFIRFAR